MGGFSGKPVYVLFRLYQNLMIIYDIKWENIIVTIMRE